MMALLHNQFAESRNLTPVDPKRYQSLLGNLTFLLKSRDDIISEVATYLSTKTRIQLKEKSSKLADLNGTRGVSRRY
jgi:hypothetical protein